MLAFGSLAASATSFTVITKDVRFNTTSIISCDSNTFMIDCLEAHNIAVPYDSRYGETPTETALLISGSVDHSCIFYKNISNTSRIFIHQLKKLMNKY
jgi:hypothetical protein